jgi:hypothetical protein
MNKIKVSGIVCVEIGDNTFNLTRYEAEQAELNYSEAAKLGKINTIIVPRDFKGMLNVGK